MQFSSRIWILKSFSWLPTTAMEENGKWRNQQYLATTNIRFIFKLKPLCNSNLSTSIGENLAMQRENEKQAIPVQQNQANSDVTWQKKPFSFIIQCLVFSVSISSFFASIPLRIWIRTSPHLIPRWWYGCRTWYVIRGP